MRQSISSTSVTILLALLVAGCTSGVGQASTPGKQPPPGPAAASSPIEVSTDAVLSSVTEAVLADAAKRTGLPRASLDVLSAMPVTWSDGSLGCPDPGMSYTMALVPGYQIKVRAGEQVLDFHASRRGHFVLCPAGRSIDPVGDAVM